MKNVLSSISLPYMDDSGHVRGNVTGFVFTNTYGNVWSEPSLRELINRIVDSLNEEAEANKTEKIENYCPHMARHTYTSLHTRLALT